jgi:hypothetical protein
MMKGFLEEIEKREVTNEAVISSEISTKMTHTTDRHTRTHLMHSSHDFVGFLKLPVPLVGHKEPGANIMTASIYAFALQQQQQRARKQK